MKVNNKKDKLCDTNGKLTRFKNKYCQSIGENVVVH